MIWTFHEHNSSDHVVGFTDFGQFYGLLNVLLCFIALLILLMLNETVFSEGSKVMKGNWG